MPLFSTAIFANRVYRITPFDIRMLSAMMKGDSCMRNWNRVMKWAMLLLLVLCVLAGAFSALADDEDVGLLDGFTAYWSMDPSKGIKAVDYHWMDELPVEHTELCYHPQDVDQKSINLIINVRINVLTEMVDGHEVPLQTFQPHEISVTFPKYLVKSWDGTPIIPVYTSQLNIPPEGTKQEGQRLCWVDKGDYIEIYNSEIVSSSITQDIVIEYRFNSGYIDDKQDFNTILNVPGGGPKDSATGEYITQNNPAWVNTEEGDSQTVKGGYKGDMLITATVKSGDEVLASENRELYLETHTQVQYTQKMRVVPDANGGVYLKWNNIWGGYPFEDDPNDYFYVLWDWTHVKNNGNQNNHISNQPWNVTVVNDSTDGGEIVGTFCGISSSSSWGSQQMDPTNYICKNIATVHDSVKDIATKSNFTYSVGQTGQAFTVLKRYPMSELTNLYDPETGLVKMTGTLGYKVKWESGYIERGQSKTPISFRLIPDVLDGSGIGTSIDHYAPNVSATHTQGKGELELGFDTQVSYVTVSTVYQDNTKEGFVRNSEQNRYVFEPTKYLITEGTFCFNAGHINNTSSNFSSGEQLNDDDYFIKSFTITNTQYDGEVVDVPVLGKQSISVGTPSTNYSAYDPIDLYARFTDAPDQYVKIGSITRSPDGKTYFLDDVAGTGNSKNTFTLPEGVLGIRFIQDMTHTRSSTNFTTNIVLKATEHMQGIVAEKTTPRHFSQLDFVVEDKAPIVLNGIRSSTMLDPFSYATTLWKGATTTEPYNDPERGEKSYIIYVDMVNSGATGQILNNPDAVRTILPTDGTFYDLLPYGTTVDMSEFKIRRTTAHSANNISINTIAYTLEKGYGQPVTDYTVEFVENWEGSGRTMMIVRYSADPINATGTNYMHICLRYKLVSSYFNINETRTMEDATLNTVAWVDNRTENYTPIVTSGRTRDTVTLGEFYSGPQFDPEHTVYTQFRMNYGEMAVLTTEFSKAVSTDLDRAYRYHNHAMVGDQYRYRLSYETGMDTYAAQLVFYDVLEGGNANDSYSNVGDPSEWKGTLVNVDLSTIRNQRDARNDVLNGIDYGTCAPVVYYTDVEVNSETIGRNGTGTDIESGIWSQSPDGLGRITAIAIDCRKTTKGEDFILNQKSAMSAYITMLAPSGTIEERAELDGKTAYNASKIFGYTGPLDSIIFPINENGMDKFARVTLHSYQPTIHKNSDPEGLDQDAPTIVRDYKLDYQVTISNISDTYDMPNVIAQDQMDPAVTKITGITYKTSKGVTGNALTGLNYHASFDADNLVVFDIATLAPGESVTYTISCELSKDEQYRYSAEANYYVIENTAVLTAVKDLEYNLESETTYHRIPETIDIPVTKVWDDNHDQDGVRPDSLRVTVYSVAADGTETEVTYHDLCADENWSHVFENLPKRVGDEPDGEEIVYIVREADTDGYTQTASSSDDILLNRHEPETIIIEVKKVWDDHDDCEAVRPSSVDVIVARTMKLYNKPDAQPVEDSTFTETLTLSKDNRWLDRLTGLPKYGKDADGNTLEYSYTVTEESVPDHYELEEIPAPIETVDGSATSYAYTLTNTHEIETVYVEGEKTWKDNDDSRRPERIMVTLRANGVAVDSKSVEKDADGKWSWRFNDLPKTYLVVEADGNKRAENVAYDVVEDPVSGYTTEYATVTEVKDDQDEVVGYQANITNTILGELNVSKKVVTTATDTTSFIFHVVFTDAADDAVTGPFTLTDANGQKLTVTAENGELTFALTNGKSVKIQDIPYGTKYVVTEDVVNGYEADAVQKDGQISDTPQTVKFVNTPLTSVSGHKIWDDADDQDGVRPEKITIQLLADGEELDPDMTKDVTEDDDWTWTFDNLPEYKLVPAPDSSEGAPVQIVYTVKELVVDEHYTAEGNGDSMNVKNVHVPETVDIYGVKIWDDANDQDGVRPEKITIRLMNGSTEVANVVLDGTEADNNGNWTWSFTDLPKYEAGGLIVYKIIEDTVSDYTMTGGTLEKETDEAGVETGNYTCTIKNTHKPETTSLPVKKVWDDADDQDGIRPEELVVKLYAGNESVKDSEGKEIQLTLKDTNHWESSFTDLPKNQNGVAIVYTAKETVPAGYTQSSTGMDNGKYTMVNKHAPATTSIKVTKVWEDANNQDGLRAPVTIKLYDGNTLIETVRETGSTGDNWSHTFEKLPVYRVGQQGVKCEYRIVEDDVPADYTSEVTDNQDGTWTVTNKHTPDTTSLTGTKTWEDDNNRDGKRPASIKVQLVADGEAVEGKTLTVEPDADGNWTYTFDGLQKNATKTSSADATREIVYTVTENLPDGSEYRLVAAGTDLTNAYEPETMSITVKKVWDDANDQDGLRAPVTIKLYDGNTLIETVRETGSTGDNWNHTFANLPVYRAGKIGEACEYRIVEDDVPAGYTANVSEIVNGKCTVTNKHTPDTTSLTGTKTWLDDNNRDGKRPASIKVQLVADGEAVEGKTLTVEPDADGNWTYTFDGLQKNATKTSSADATREIVYTVTENLPDGSEYRLVAAGTDLTNAYEPETMSITVKKVWEDANDQDGLRAPVTIKLYDGDTLIETVRETGSTGDNWNHTFANLPVYREGKVGEACQYRIEEEDVPTGYTSEVTDNQDGTWTVTNTHKPETTSLTGTKTWEDDNNRDGKRPASIKVQLVADGEAVEGKTLTVEPDADGNWTYTFEDLQKNATKTSSADATREIVYTVTEIQEQDSEYEFVVTGADLTNTYEPKTIDITVKKVWEDANDQDGLRAPVTIKLYDGDTLIETVHETGSTGDNWSHTFEKLPVYRVGQQGVKCEYRIVEDDVPAGYTANVSEIVNGKCTVTNEHTPDTTSLTGTKTWLDDDNRDGKRPTSIKVQLVADGVAVESKTLTVEPDADGNWTYTFGGLQKNATKTSSSEETREIVYTVTENLPDGSEYRLVAAGTDLTNAYEPETMSITVKKVWEDANDQDGLRAPVTIKLYDGDTLIETVRETVSTGDSWNYTFSDLPVYRTGKIGEACEYRIVEDDVPAGYTANVSEIVNGKCTVTNEHTPDTTSLTGTKTWEDDNNRDGKRPASIKVQLVADGVAVESKTLTVEPDADGNWTYTFDGLQKNATKTSSSEETREIVYTVTENLPDGSEYRLVAAGTDLTNAYEPETMSITVKKVWEDANNQDGLRAPVTIKLYDGDTLIETVRETVSTGDSWNYTFYDLPVYRAGKIGEACEYRIVEDDVPAGYTANVSEIVNGKCTVTNKHTPDTTSLTGTKTWLDDDNRDGKRPASIKVQLVADGEAVEGKTLTVEPDADGNWTYTFDGLQKNTTKTSSADATREIVYTVTENLPDGSEYRLVAAGTDLTNAYEPETMSITVKKVWDDANDQDGLRKAVTIKLYDDEKLIETVHEVGSTGDHWSYTFSDLPVYRTGKIGEACEYRIVEDDVPAGYTANVSEIVNGKCTVTNEHTPDTTSLTGTKTWEDDNNRDGKRPTSIKVQLVADGEAVEGKTLTVEPDADGNWTYTFDGLQKNTTKTSSADATREIVYTVTENLPDGSEYRLVAAGTDLTNAYEPETMSITVKKVWDDANDQDGLRKAVTIKLYDGDTLIETVHETGSTGDNWSHTFEKLPVYRVGQQGVKCEYRIVEDDVPAGYTANVSEIVNGKCTVTNKHTPDTTSLTGTKTWEDDNNRDGKRPASIKVQLVADGEAVEGKTLTVEPDADGNWTYTFDGLQKNATKTSSADATREIVYTVTENLPDGSEYRLVAAGTDLTNAYEPETMSITVKKVWDDANDQDGLRKPVTIKLYDDEKLIETVHEVGSTGDHWSYTFSDLPVYRTGKIGEACEYRIVEDDVPAGYTANVSEIVNGKCTVTNEHTPETTSLTGTKTWLDDDNRDGKRPTSIEVQLVADGEAVEGKTLTVEPDADGNWTYTFDGLQKNATKTSSADATREIVYTVTENLPDGSEYRLVATGTDLTNAYDPEMVSLEVTKTWDDADDQDGLRSESITVSLTADDEVIDTVVIKPDDEGEWSWKFEDLPRNKRVDDAVTEIVYKVIEETIVGYETDYAYSDVTEVEHAVNVTNVHVPEVTELSGQKIWNDKDNRDGLRPESIKMTLMADGVAVEDSTITVKPDADGNWTYEYTDLPKYKDHGTEIVYTVSESEITGYTTAYIGKDVVNSHDTELTSITVEKEWKDDNDRDGLRPEKLKVTLNADGWPMASHELTEAEGWTYTFEELNVYKPDQEGQLIVYTITEEEIAGYEAKIDLTEAGVKITNTHVPEKVKLEGAKTWKDDEDRDGLRPAEIEIRVQDGEMIVAKQIVTADEQGKWAWSFTNLPKYKDHGTEIKYTLSEKPVTGYETMIDGMNVTNSHKPATTEIAVTKVWVDKDDMLNVRPESIEVKLYADGVEVNSVELTAETKWAAVFTDLPVYRDHGIEIKYTVDETEISAYRTEINGSAEEGFGIKNILVQASMPVEAIKYLEKGNLSAGQFTFQLREGKQVLQSVKNDAAGKVTFEAIKWTKSDVGEHKLEISEVNDSQKYVKYDQRVFTMTVMVDYDAENSMLTWQVTDISDSTGEHGLDRILFYNEWTEDRYDVAFKFYKQWSDGDAKHPTPKFVLYDASGRVIRTAEQPPKKTGANEYTYWLRNEGVYYVVEESMDGYTAIYANEGEYSDVTDRVYQLGTITNYSVPKTGDNSGIELYMAFGAMAALAMVGLLRKPRKRTR